MKKEDLFWGMSQEQQNEYYILLQESLGFYGVTSSQQSEYFQQLAKGENILVEMRCLSDYRKGIMSTTFLDLFVFQTMKAHPGVCVGELEDVFSPVAKHLAEWILASHPSCPPTVDLSIYGKEVTLPISQEPWLCVPSNSLRESLISLLDPYLDSKGSKHLLTHHQQLPDSDFLVVLSLMLTTSLRQVVPNWQVMIDSFLAAILLKGHERESQRVTLSISRGRTPERQQMVQLIGLVSFGITLLSDFSYVLNLKTSKKPLNVSWKDILDGRLICGLFDLSLSHPSNSCPTEKILNAFDSSLTKKFKLLQSCFVKPKERKFETNEDVNVNSNSNLDVEGILIL